MGGVGVKSKSSPTKVKVVKAAKLVKIVLETWNLVRKYTVCNFRKYNFQYHEPLDFADVSILCAKISIVAKNSTFTQINSMGAVLELFSSVFSFCKVKGYY